MALIDDLVTLIAQKAKWKEPVAQGNKYSFSLENDLDFEIFSPDGKTCIMQAKIVDLPDDLSQKNNLLQDYAKHLVASCKKRSSVLTIEEDKNILLLFSKYTLNAHDLERIAEGLGTFLNDLDWWKNISKGKSSTYSNPFGNSFSIRAIPFGIANDIL